MSDLTGIGSVISSIIGASQQRSDTRKMIEFQKEENEKARQWNKMMAETSNEWSIEQWNRENQYNTPANIRKRLSEGGYSPDLAYGNIANLTQAATSPEVSRPSPAYPVDGSAIAQQETIGSAVARGVSVLKNLAETKKTTVETKGSEEYNKILASDAAFRDALNTNQWQEGNVRIMATKKGLDLTDAQIDNLRQQTSNLSAELKNIDATYEKLIAETSNVKVQEWRTILDGFLASEQFDHIVRQIDSQTTLNYVEARTLAEKTVQEMRVMSSQIDLNYVMGGYYSQLRQNVHVGTDYLEFNLDNDKDYRDVERSMTIFKDAAVGVGILLGGVSNWLPMGKAANAVKGFRR